MIQNYEYRYIKEASYDNDVYDLQTKVDFEFVNQENDDPELLDFINSLSEKIEDDGIATDSDEKIVSYSKVKVREGGFGVRVRSTPETSDNSNIIGKAISGDEFTKLGEDGIWTKIFYYDGTEAYIMTEYLETID